METLELLKQVRKVEIKTRRLSDHLFGGEYHSTFKGRGMTFSEVRQYQYGDDVRNIDWNVTARYNEPFVKVFEEERELTLMLLVDVSKSSSFATHIKFKKDIITEISATLAFSATNNNDKIGLILFSEQVELFIPPKKGKSHVLRIIRELIEFKPTKKKTNISFAIRYLTDILKKKAIIFILSDFIDSNYDHTLQVASRKHDITGIRVYDRAEENIPNLGFIQVYEEETGKYIWVNTGSKKIRASYKKNYQEYTSYFQESFKKKGLGTLNIEVGESYVKKLLGYFKSR